MATARPDRYGQKLNPVARVGRHAWRTLTSVRFAIFQIGVLSVAGLIGAALRQLPAYALHNPVAYATELSTIRASYESLNVLGMQVGPQLVDVFDRLGFFRVFSAPWFVFLLTLLTVSIVVCTVNRVPDLWRAAHDIRIEQPGPFFDLRLALRARFNSVNDSTADQLGQLLRNRHFKVRESLAVAAGDEGEIRHLYGDRNQYVKLATLFTHLGLILFLAGGAITSLFGYETVIFLGEGQTAPVLPVGMPDNLLLKNIRFEAPTRPDGSFADFRTDLAVFQNGQQVARKTIRVNDPLEVNGYAIHQNTFGPAEQLSIRDPTGALVWDGPVLLDGALLGRPQGFLTVPGSLIGLLLVLDRTVDGIPLLAITGLGPTATPNDTNLLFVRALGLGETSEPYITAGYEVTWKSAGAYTGMYIKRDPGQDLIWIAYLSLITGLVVTFYFPRRRVWARLSADHIELAFVGDRYVNAEREFDGLLEALSVRMQTCPERPEADAIDP